MDSLQEKVAARVNAKKPLMLGMMAKEFGVAELTVAAALPLAMRRFASKETFDAVWTELVSWEKATCIMHCKGTVLEVKGAIPPGVHGHGYFNLKSESGLGGHLKVDDLSCMAFLSMPFMGLESLSIQFFDTDGAVKFSIYAGRIAKTIIPAVRESFTRLFEAASEEIPA